MNVRALHLNNHLVTSICFAMLIFGVLAYMYFLSLSVVHVVMRKEATAEIGKLRSEIAKLETSYIEAKHVISAKVATTDGYNQNQDKIFIHKDTALVLRTTAE